jgi:hypothetical protein
VEKLELGAKTTVKLKEIVATGQLRRNVEFEGDERRLVLAMFGEVWGVADQTAQKWYAQGGP